MTSHIPAVGIKLLPFWSEDTPIAWQLAGRKSLNEVIRRFNDWQTTLRFDPLEAEVALAYTKLGISTIGAMDGGEGYLIDLKLMESHILSWKEEVEAQEEGGK